MSNIEEITKEVILAYLNRELSNDEMIKVDLWLGRSSKNMEMYSEVREIWKKNRYKKTESTSEKRMQTGNSYDKQQYQNSDHGNNRAKPKATFKMAFLAAAVVFLVGVGATTFFVFEDPHEANGMLELSSGDDETVERLSDGSYVTLEPYSVLWYPPHFDEFERKVKLDGECYFEIEDYDDQPFIIEFESSDAYIEVLGTDFNVRAYNDEDQIEVSVDHGEVEIVSDQNVIVLSEGEVAVIDIYSGEIKKI